MSVHSGLRRAVPGRHADWMVGVLAVVLAFGAGGAVLVATASEGGGTGARPAPAPSLAPTSYQAPLPVPLTVLRRFDPPATRFGPGHLGVDLAAPRGAPVASAANGIVQFAGPVAGRGVVVVAHPDGVRTEYEPVRPLVRSGDQVLAGQVIATVRGAHAGCSTTCLHWGARRGDTYLDPLALLRTLGPVVLLPDRPQVGTQARG